MKTETLARLAATTAPAPRPTTAPVPRLMLRQAEQIVIKTAHDFKDKPTDANRDRLFSSVELLESLLPPGVKFRK